MKTPQVQKDDIVQISFDNGKTWLDYAGAEDTGFALALVKRGWHRINLEGAMGRFRIVRKHLGTLVIAG